MRKETFGANALNIRPPATITPLNTVTGRAPKLSTQALHTGPAQRETQKRWNSHTTKQKNVIFV